MRHVPCEPRLAPLPRLNLATTLGLLLAAGMTNLADDSPTFTAHPGSQNVPVGVNVLLSAHATSSLPVNYLWQLNGAPIAGQTNSTLDLFCVSMVQSGHVYTAVAQTTAGSATSSPALLQVFVPDSGRTPRTWGINPAAQLNSFSPMHARNNVGAIYHADLFNVSLSGLWGTDYYTDDSSLPAAAVHAGLVTAGQRATVAVRITGPREGFAGSTRNGVTSTGWGSYGGSYQLVGLVPTITRHPQARVCMVGAPVTFAVEAFGNGALLYQWRHNGVELQGETNATLQLTVNSVTQAGSYAVNVMDGEGTNTSDHAVLGVLPYNVGSPQTTLGAVSGFAGDFKRMVITGNTNSGSVWGVGIYTTDMSLPRAAVHAGLLRHGETGVLAVVRLPNQPFFLGDTLNNVTSIPFGVFAAQAFLGRVPQVLVHPRSQVVLAGQSATLDLEATHPSSLAIQWRKNGQIITGATADKYTVSAATPGEPAVYDAVLSVPGNPTVTEPTFIFTPAASTPIVTVSTASQGMGYMGQTGTLVYFPLTGSTNVGDLSLWGTGIYSSGSDVAAAAVHAGVLAPGQSGTVGVYMVGQWPSYRSSTRQGITSRSYGSYPGFAFVSPSSTPAPPRLIMTSAGNLLIENALGHACQIWRTPSLSAPAWSLADTFVPTSSPQPWTDTNAWANKQYYRAIMLP